MPPLSPEDQTLPDPDAERALEEALAWSNQVNWDRALAALAPWVDREPAARALAQGIEAVTEVYAGRFGSALRRLLACLPALEKAALGARVDWFYAATAYALGMLGDPVRGLEWSARALALTEARPHSAGQRRALSTQGTLLAMAGDHLGAWAALRAALAVAETEGHPRSIAIALGNLAYCAVDEAQGLALPAAATEQAARAREALPWAARAHEQALQAGLPLYEGFAATSHGAALAMLDQAEQALPHLERAVESTAVNPQMQGDALLWLAKVLRRLGRHDEAHQALARAQALADEGGLQVLLGRALDEAQAQCLALGQTEAALVWAQRAVDFWKRLLADRTVVLRRHTALFAELEESRKELGRLRQQSEALAEAAQRDALTQVLNRRGLSARADAWRGVPISVAAIDVDHFKRINDSHGHAIGDAVLQALAALLSEHCRRDDVVVRLGGEEFLVVFPRAPLHVAQVSAERLRRAIAGHLWADLVPDLAVTASFGVSEGSDGAHLAHLIAEADAALYEAKRAGRNRVLLHRSGAAPV